MSQEVSVQQMSLEVLAQRCKQETERYFEQVVNDTRFCFELFRRAFQGKDDRAWKEILDNYKNTITGWVVRHYGFASSGLEVQDVINDVFKKILSTMTAEKFGRFTSLPALLGYLKLCVHSVIVDCTRATDYTKLIALDNALKVRSTEPSPEEQTVDASERKKFWELLRERLHDEKERLVVHGSFVLDLKPQELLEQFPKVFNSIDEIYRIKQNVLTRLRRDAEFRKFLGIDA